MKPVWKGRLACPTEARPPRGAGQPRSAAVPRGERLRSGSAALGAAPARPDTCGRLEPATARGGAGWCSNNSAWVLIGQHRRFAFERLQRRAPSPLPGLGAWRSALLQEVEGRVERPQRGRGAPAGDAPPRGPLGRAPSAAGAARAADARRRCRRRRWTRIAAGRRDRIAACHFVQQILVGHPGDDCTRWRRRPARRRARSRTRSTRCQGRGRERGMGRAGGCHRRTIAEMLLSSRLPPGPAWRSRRPAVALRHDQVRDAAPRHGPGWAASSSESSGAAVATSSSARLPASRSSGEAMPCMRSRSDTTPQRRSSSSPGVAFRRWPRRSGCRARPWPPRLRRGRPTGST